MIEEESCYQWTSICVVGGGKKKMDGKKIRNKTNGGGAVTHIG